MIFIKVKSEVQDTYRQFETDIEATKYLKQIKETHKKHREYLFNKANHQTKTLKHPNGTLFKRIFLATCLPLRVDIHNTDTAQYNLKAELA